VISVADILVPCTSCAVAMRLSQAGYGVGNSGGVLQGVCDNLSQWLWVQVYNVAGAVLAQGHVYPCVCL
jgi:hypothetical protein